jgi:hypothetical protein
VEIFLRVFNFIIVPLVFNDEIKLGFLGVLIFRIRAKAYLKTGTLGKLSQSFSLKVLGK